MPTRLPITPSLPRSRNADVNTLATALTAQIGEILSFLSVKQPWQLPAFAVADVPDAAQWEGALIYVPDEAGGPTVAVSDGADWLRLSDGSVVS